MIFRIVTGSIGSRCAAKIFRQNPFLSKRWQKSWQVVAGMRCLSDEWGRHKFKKHQTESWWLGRPLAANNVISRWSRLTTMVSG